MLFSFSFGIHWHLWGAVQTLDLALMLLPAQLFQKVMLFLVCVYDAFPSGTTASVVSRVIDPGPGPAAPPQHLPWSFISFSITPSCCPLLAQFLLI